MFHLKLNYNQLITLKATYFQYCSTLTDINADIHELLQEKLHSYKYQRDYKNKYQEYFIFKIDYEKLVNIYYFIEARFVWMEIKNQTLKEIHSMCEKKINKYEKKNKFISL